MTASDHQARKRLENLRAAAAFFFGVALECLESDEGRQVFIATRGPLVRRFDSLDAVAEWLDSDTVTRAEAG